MSSDEFSILATLEARTAELAAALDALSAVMATLAAQAGSPSELRAWDHARALLVEHGRSPDGYRKQYEAWEARRR